MQITTGITENYKLSKLQSVLIVYKTKHVLHKVRSNCIQQRLAWKKKPDSGAQRSVLISLLRDLATVIFNKVIINHPKNTFLKMYDFLLRSAVPVIREFCWNLSGENFSSTQAYQL